MKKEIKFLFFGDVVGILGREAIYTYLKSHKEKDKIDFVIANCENATHGKGLSYKHYNEILSYGVDCITSGNHFFDNKDSINSISKMDKFVRPMNLDKNCPGVGTRTFDINGVQIQVTNLIGRVFLQMAQSNPFYLADRIIDTNKDAIQIFDLHAEATAEKEAFGYYLDGRASAVFGTHTHVQTNDLMLLPKSTLYMSDVGMNGALYSSLGVDIDSAMYRTITGMHSELVVNREGKVLVNAVQFSVDTTSKKVNKFKIIRETFDHNPDFK